MTTELEHRLRADLHAVDGAPLDPSIGDRVDGLTRARRHRQRAGVAAACVALVGAGVVGIALTGNGDPAPPVATAATLGTTVTSPPPATTGAPPTTATSAATTATTMPAPVAEVEPWSITTLAPDPRGTVDEPAAVWTGSEIITTAGSDGIAAADRTFVDGGAIYDPATDRWLMVSGPGPLLADAGWEAVRTIEVWTGDEMLVLGDNERGARYDPATDTWNRLQFPFDGDITADTPHVWTGDEWLVWPDSGPVAYSPSAQKWRQVAAPPIDGRIRAASVWSGSEWLVWGGRTVGGDDVGEHGDGAAYDPATDTWRIIAEAPIGPRWVDGVWASGELFVQAGARGPDNGSFALDDGAAYDPATDTWRSLTPGPAHPGIQVAASGERIFTFFKGFVMVYDIASDAWHEAGGTATGYTTGPALWAGDRLVILGGTTPFAVREN